MSPDPLTAAQRAAEFAAPPPGDVPRPPWSDPVTDPPCTVRVQDWARRLDPTVRRVVKASSDTVPEHPWALPWVQVSGPAPTDRGEGDDADRYASSEVTDWPVVSLLCVGMAFRHAHRAAEVAGRRAPGALDGADAEGAAPFRSVDPRPEG